VRERARDLERLRLALEAHDPERTLERGFALVEDDAGEPVTSAQRARNLERLGVRFADGRLEVHTGNPRTHPRLF
jgi:exodeoxyribonuclease VII large subunit